MECETLKRGPKPATIKQLFWSKVQKTPDCWLWTGSKTRGGYGLLVHCVNNKKTPWRAHRLSFVLHNETIPPETLVLHKCDNPACVRPSHLFLGSHNDNVMDKVRKNRQSRGEGNKSAKLTAAQVYTIRYMRKWGFTYKEIAVSYGVSISPIRDICKGYAWKHV